MKSHGLIVELLLILLDLRVLGENGIPGVRVKSVDIGKNTNSEGNSLGHF